jgi:transcriptional regulator with XRE-family HTH domain
MKKTLNTGKKIRIARLLRGYSQDNVAHELGIKQQTYQLLENGETHLSEERFEKICSILKMEVEFVKILDDIDLLKTVVMNYIKSMMNTKNEGTS